MAVVKTILKKYYSGQILAAGRPKGAIKKAGTQRSEGHLLCGVMEPVAAEYPRIIGIGTALKTLVDELGLDALQGLYKDQPFFNALILNSMMSMSKCYFVMTPLLKICCPGITQGFKSISATEFILQTKQALATWPGILSGLFFSRKNDLCTG